MNDAPARGGSIPPLQLQLLEVSLAAVAGYLAVHFASRVSVVAAAAGVVIGALAFATAGPIGIVRKVTPLVNVCTLGAIGVVATLAPLAFAWARSTDALIVLEGGAVLIALTITWVLRSPRGATAPVQRSTAKVPGRSMLAEGTNSSLRAVGRFIGRTRAVVAVETPVVARRTGRFIGSRRNRRS